MDNYPLRNMPISQRTEEPSDQKQAPRKKPKSVEYTGPLVACQIRLPEDMLKALRLHAINENTSVSKLVAECCSTERMIQKCHVRMAPRDAA